MEIRPTKLEEAWGERDEFGFGYVGFRYLTDTGSRCASLVVSSKGLGLKGKGWARTGYP